MKQIFPGIWQWSWFSDEKQLDFNGLFLMVGEHKILVDPPPMTAEARSFVRRNGPVDYIIVTNRDHEGGWALQLVAPEPPVGSKAARAAKKRVTPAAADEPPAQVLSFTLDEVREARLVPVVDFKGRRAPALEPEAATQESGGHEE